MAADSVGNLKPFTTVKYTTVDGENCEATKKDGIVTIVGDKNGVRELPVEEFITKELPKVDLERAPEKDEVNFKGTEAAKTQESHAGRNAAIAGTVGVVGGGLGGYYLSNPILKDGKYTDKFIDAVVNEKVKDLKGVKPILEVIGKENVTNKEIQEVLKNVAKDLTEANKAEILGEANRNLNLAEITEEQAGNVKENISNYSKNVRETAVNDIDSVFDKEAGKFKKLQDSATDAEKKVASKIKNIAMKLKAKPAMITAAATAAVLAGGAALLSGSSEKA